MSTNRLLPHQFAPGVTLDGTRIEQALIALVDQFNDVPPDCVQKRWSPSWMVWGLSPEKTAAPRNLPFLVGLNHPAFGSSSLEAVTSTSNPYRAKSAHLAPTGDIGRVLEVSFVSSKPVIIGGLCVMAEAETSGGPYQNRWKYGATPPAGKVTGDPTDDFTLQATVSDGWDLENRKKLRQEALVCRRPSSAFLFSPVAESVAVVDSILPPRPLTGGVQEPFRGFAVSVSPLILVPRQGRVRFQFTIPGYPNADASTWGAYPANGNAWSLAACIYEATE